MVYVYGIALCCIKISFILSCSRTIQIYENLQLKAKLAGMEKELRNSDGLRVKTAWGERPVTSSVLTQSLAAVQRGKQLLTREGSNHEVVGVGGASSSGGDGGKRRRRSGADGKSADEEDDDEGEDDEDDEDDDDDDDDGEVVLLLLLVLVVTNIRERERERE